MSRVKTQVSRVIAALVCLWSVDVAVGGGRAYVVYEPSHPSSYGDALEVAQALIALGWSVNGDANGVPEQIVMDVPRDDPKFNHFKAHLDLAWGGPPANDVLKLFYYAGHAGLDWDKDPPDESENHDHSDCNDIVRPGYAPDECDEGLVQPYRDDELTALFEEYTGFRMFVFDTCYAGGLFDSCNDLHPEESVILSACEAHEEANYYYFLTHLHLHGHFTFYLVKALRGAADAPPGDGNIMAGEVYDYVVAGIDSSFRLCAARYQHPVGWPERWDPAWNTVLGPIPSTGVAEQPVFTEDDCELDPDSGGACVESIPATSVSGTLAMGMSLVVAGMIVARRLRTPRAAHE